jgi:hypothetical protein
MLPLRNNFTNIKCLLHASLHFALMSVTELLMNEDRNVLSTRVIDSE